MHTCPPACVQGRIQHISYLNFCAHGVGARSEKVSASACLDPWKPDLVAQTVNAKAPEVYLRAEEAHDHKVSKPRKRRSKLLAQVPVGAPISSPRLPRHHSSPIDLS